MVRIIRQIRAGIRSVSFPICTIRYSLKGILVENEAIVPEIQVFVLNTELKEMQGCNNVVETFLEPR